LRRTSDGVKRVREGLRERVELGEMEEGERGDSVGRVSE